MAEDAQAEITLLKAQVANLESAQERVNKESKSHRLNAETFQRQADELRTRLGETEQKLTAAEAKHVGDLDKVKLDLTARAAAAETKAAETIASAHGRVLTAKLETAADKAGLGNLAYLKLFDDKAEFKTDDDGNLLGPDGKALDAEAWFTAKKEAFPHLFGVAKPGTVTGTTTSTAIPPRTAPSSGPDVRKMEPKEYEARKAEMLASR